MDKQINKEQMLEIILKEFSAQEELVNGLGDALMHIAREGYFDEDGQWQQPKWKQTVLFNIAQARALIQKYYNIVQQPIKEEKGGINMPAEENKELFIALCGYYPHGVMVKIEGYGIGKLTGIDNHTVSTAFGINYPLRLVKPYLRTMDSMTEEEQIKFSSLCELTTDSNGEKVWSVSVNGYDWLNANFFDYRNFIPRGMAYEAKEGMYADAVNNAG